jgi:hypothetical protein
MVGLPYPLDASCLISATQSNMPGSWGHCGFERESALRKTMPAISVGESGTSEALLASPDARSLLADRLESMLFQDALDAHWPAGRDEEFGGFLPELQRSWRPTENQRKSLEFQVRQATAYARAARMFPQRGYEQAALQGYEFLTSAMWDTTDGGFFTLVDRAGSPLEEGRKHPHGHIYAIELFIELVPLIGEPAARKWVDRTFAWLEDVAWDRVDGGYWGYYDRDNVQIRKSGPGRSNVDWLGTPIGLKDLNVFVDALSALMSLEPTGWSPVAEERLNWHISLLLEHILHRFEIPGIYYTVDWSTVPDICRAGQPFQLIAKLVPWSLDKAQRDAILSKSVNITEACIHFFAHPDGGYMFGRSVYPMQLRNADLRVPVRDWWVQTEAARALLALALVLPESAVWTERFAAQLNFIESSLIDGRCRGFYECPRNDMAAPRSPWYRDRSSRQLKTHIWKDLSHESHFLMDAVQWLRMGVGPTMAVMN